MKKQRWRWTKQPLVCAMCGNSAKQNYTFLKKYHICSEKCGKMKYGLDFISDKKQTSAYDFLFEGKNNEYDEQYKDYI